MRRGLVDAAELRAMLSLQAELRNAGRHFPLARLLVESGIIDAAELGRILRRRHKLTLAALAGLTLWAGSSGPATAGDRAFVTLSARVLSRTSIDMQRVPEHLVVSPQDAARGYVDVQEPVELLIRSNHPGAVFLGFTRLAGYLQAIDVGASEGGTPLAIESGAVVLPQLGRGLRTRTVSLRLRFMLAPGTTAGTIPFPLVLFVAPG